MACATQNIDPKTAIKGICHFLGIFNIKTKKGVTHLLVWDPPPPLGAENVKIRENSEKIRGPPGVP